MSVQNDHQASHSQAEDAWTDYGSDFVLIAEGKPPPRIELARERLLICRLYLGLLQTITDDYGAEFAAHLTLGLSNHWHLRLPPHRHVFARSRKSDRARAEATSRIRSAAS